MDAQIQNQGGGKELADRIKANLEETQHRFELQDPFADTTFRFQTAEAATAKADELGASRLQARDADGQVSQINKVDGEWKRDDGKALADIQAGIDKASVSAIEARAEQRAAVGQGVDADTDKQMALADAHAFRRIQDPSWQESAAVQMADNTRDYPEYKTSLDKAIPGYPGTSEKVYALDAANTEKVMVKEERKAVEMASMLQEREDRAKNWTPEEAAKQAQRDSQDYGINTDKTERAYMRDDMAWNAGANPAYQAALEKVAPEVAQEVKDTQAAKLTAVAPTVESAASAASVADTLTLDPSALERVAAARARDSAQAREALGLNTVEPNLEKEKQQLVGEEEVKRSAWLKKAEEAKTAQPVANEKEVSGNKVESDEIFTASQADVKPVVPSDIEKQYLRVGDKFYHPKNTDLVAFEDKGNKLETKSNSEAIAETMVRIAEARGWDEIKVSGSEAFRKEVWLEAASRGMHVKGYSPSEQDKAELAKRSSETEANKVEKENKPFRARENEKEQAAENKGDAPAQSSAPAVVNAPVQSAPPVAANTEAQASDDKAIKGAVGVLVAHGAAKYMHDEKNTGSYYVTTRDDKGTEKTSWGVDLERAMKESGAKPGDKIVLANEGQKQVTVTVPVRDDSGKVVGSEEKDARRNSWNVQMAETFAKESAVDAVKKHPELAGAAAAVAMMDKQAEADGLNPAQRAIVAARVRQNVVNSIERGDIPQVTVKEEVEVKREVNNDKEYTR